MGAAGAGRALPRTPYGPCRRSGCTAAAGPLGCSPSYRAPTRQEKAFGAGSPWPAPGGPAWKPGSGQGWPCRWLDKDALRASRCLSPAEWGPRLWPGAAAAWRGPAGQPTVSPGGTLLAGGGRGTRTPRDSGLQGRPRHGDPGPGKDGPVESASTRRDGSEPAALPPAPQTPPLAALLRVRPGGGGGCGTGLGSGQVGAEGLGDPRSREEPAQPPELKTDANSRNWGVWVHGKSLLHVL